MASDPPSFGPPYPDDPSTREAAGAPPPGAERPDGYAGPGGAAPTPPPGARMMPNDYPPGYPPYGPYRPPESPSTRTPAWVKVLGGCLIVGVVLTVLFGCALALTAGSVAAFFNSTPVSATSSQTLAVAGVPTVRIHGQAGNIRVMRGDTGAVVVQATKYVRGYSSGDAQAALSQIAVTVTQSGNEVEVQVNEPDDSGGIHLWWTERHVDLSVSVPAQANLAATLNAGNVDVSDVAGTIAVHDNAGNLNLDNVVLAGSSSATDNAGNIDLSGALQLGASFEARTNAGNVTATLPRDTSAHLVALSDVGNVTVDPAWPISVTHEVARGSATGDLVPDPAGSLILQTNVGNVTLSAA